MLFRAWVLVRRKGLFPFPACTFYTIRIETKNSDGISPLEREKARVHAETNQALKEALRMNFTKRYILLVAGLLIVGPLSPANNPSEAKTERNILLLSSLLHVDTIPPDMRQSGQDLNSLPADCRRTKWNAYSVLVCGPRRVGSFRWISGPDDQPNRKSEIIERWRRRSERRT